MLHCYVLPKGSIKSFQLIKKLKGGSVESEVSCTSHRTCSCVVELHIVSIHENTSTGALDPEELSQRSKL